MLTNIELCMYKKRYTYVFLKKIFIWNFQASEFRVVQNAFKALEFADLAIESIWKLVAVILHLGNIDFDATEDNGEQIASISR